MRYFVIHSSGQQYGPADLATLQQWIAEGRVLPNTELQDADTGARLSAASVPGLAFPGSGPMPGPMPGPVAGPGIAGPAAGMPGASTPGASVPGFQVGAAPQAPSAPQAPGAPGPAQPYGASVGGHGSYSQPPAYGQTPGYSPYQRPGVGSGDAQGHFTKSIIFSILGVLCCPVIFSVLGIVYGSKAKEAGHPNGQTAFILGIVSLVLGLGFGAFSALGRLF